MDTVTIEKLQAMKRYRKTHFLQSLIQYSLTAFVLGLCVSNGMASLYSYMKFFFLVSLPKMGAFVVCPKCLFVVCNMIVIYLVGESKLVGSSSSSSNSSCTSSDVYDDYLKHSKGRRSLTTKEIRKEKLEVTSLIEEKLEEVIKETHVLECGEEKRGGLGEEEKNIYKEKGGGGDLGSGDQEEVGLPADELYKRAEHFIAKVNRQRRLEAKIMKGKKV